METLTSSAQPESRSYSGRIPASTYRLQFNEKFTFRQASEITEYLHELGISDCYASPVFTARPGSSHGYDVCNFAEISPALGGEEAFCQWADQVRHLGMGILLDMVPNHMGADPSNPWWWQVLQDGPGSKFATWFDINWRSPSPELEQRVLLPILEDCYWKVLEDGKLRVVLSDAGFVVAYHDLILPISRASRSLLEDGLLEVSRNDVLGGSSWERLRSALKFYNHLTSIAATPEIVSPKVQELILEWNKATSKDRIELENALQRFNGVVGDARSFDRLDALLRQQHYRLAYWRLAGEEINYRRFFDVSSLVSLRTELAEVFEASQALVLRLVQEGKVTGLRIDHPDGLWNPKQYFQRLQQRFASQLPANALPNPSLTEGGPAIPQSSRPLYVVAEKILSGTETLPSDWPVAGTTGYDFLNLLNGLFAKTSNCPALDQLYTELAGAAPDFKSCVVAGKEKILQTTMRADLRAVALRLHSIASRTRYGVDFSPGELEQGLTQIVAAFPVYRTYLTEESKFPTAQEKNFIEEAVASAKQRSEISNSAVLSFIEALLLLSPPADLDECGQDLVRQFVMRFQQLTGPVTAKGVEDTAFYNYNRFLSLNEVGGAPDVFGTNLDLFHRQNQWRAEHWPHSLLATATHDTKRGEDLRARLNVLSEMPGEWRQAVLRWTRVNADKKTKLGGQPAPDANDEYFLYQTLVGAWIPEAEKDKGLALFRDRISNYMTKAIREAKTHTSWTEPNGGYEQACARFVDQLLTHSQENAFMDDFMLFHRKIALFGLFNSLAQVVLKMTAPGVPDFYQGTELWDYSLVDPDNRRCVDYQTRKELLSDLREKLHEAELDVAQFLRGLLRNFQTGQIKLYLIWRILQLRHRLREFFEEAGYIPIVAGGPKHEHICSFARVLSGKTLITVAARWALSLANGAERGVLDPDVWQNTVLPVPNGVPGTRFRNVITGQVISIGEDTTGLLAKEALALLPVAVLEQIE